MKITSSNKQVVYGKSVENYFTNLVEKAIEDKKTDSQKQSKKQMDSFGQWREADFGR